MYQHIYKSKLGDDFISWEDYITTKVFDSEWIQLDPEKVKELESSEVFAKYFMNWIKYQQIVSHVILKDGREVFKEEFNI